MAVQIGLTFDLQNNLIEANKDKEYDRLSLTVLFSKANVWD